MERPESCAAKSLGIDPALTTNALTEGGINFISGGTLFPAIEAAPPLATQPIIIDEMEQVNKNNNDVDNSNPPWLDPVVHNDFNLVQMSLKSSERRFALSKFNDVNIFKLVRTYLSFFHDQSPTVCVEGHTKLSIEIFIRSTGLPTQVEELKGLFVEFVSRFDITEEQVQKDFMTMRKYISSDRINRLQRNESSMKNFLGFQLGFQ